jgi:hypothetical protein
MQEQTFVTDLVEIAVEIGVGCVSLLGKEKKIIINYNISDFFLNYFRQKLVKLRDCICSPYSSALALRWPCDCLSPIAYRYSLPIKNFIAYQKFIAN